MTAKPTVGVIGSGRLGTAVASLLLRAGCSVRIANSRGPESMKLMLSVLLPGAVASTVEDAVAKSDIVVLAIPLHEYTTLPRVLFKDKITIDAMNYWPPTEGDIAEFMQSDTTPSQYIAQYLTGARVVKTLNHVAYNELGEHSLPHGNAGRRAIAMAGDDQDVKAVVSTLIDAMGFDVVDMGALAQGRLFQPDTPLFNARLSAAEMRSVPR